ncbi:hypothetical protein EJ03DRAFT_341556 [Teratosphaeria nubilosa]|uniref:Zn(2)-C6 fungal-type domain-containing protein n=1 Tax=Teratosphaeria nubilosa TaxID=161662 RepID=A0A6G1LI31_9PEZI|nr:hypothetical protein EJ03DRAFT_341556 [Teratosphaeria nubilosa]
MSNYPPPPQPESHHYNAIYPTSAGAQQFDAVHPEPLQYASLNHPTYPKVESGSPDHTAATQIQSLAHDLNQHAALEEQQRHQIHQAAHHIHHQHPGVTSVHQAPSIATSHPHQGPPQEHQKSNRLRKACDSCSIRKVKCDESGPPCRACAALDIPCTFDRPSRRRGPPNRHAEAIKRRRLEEAAGSPGLSGISSPSSPTGAAQALAALSSHTSGQPLSAESICPLETIDLLIDDFFTYIHPLCPFPHEPSFREAWKRREDLSNKSFLALLASMMGALVASFPRKPRLHLKAQKRESLFLNHMSLVHRCQQVCAMARGPGYLETDNLSVYDAATSYFLALMGIYTFRWRLGRLYFGECLTILRTLGLHKAKEPTFTQLGSLPTAYGQTSNNQENREQTVDNITLEMGRRIFWTMFVSVKTVQQLGASFGELVIPPPTSSEPYPPLPAEVDDFCIYPTHNEPQPPGLVPMIAGFNANVKVFCSYNALATMEMAWGIDAVVDWERQKKVLHQSLQRCKESIAQLPPELTVYPSSASFGDQNQPNGNGNGFNPNFAQPTMLRDPASALMSPSHRNDDQSPEQRRRMQYEIQKANIYASSLATRSYIVEKFFNLCEAHRMQQPGSMPSSPGTGITAAGLDGILPQGPTSHFDLSGHEMKQEREDIVKDLLTVLSSINQVNMEPNADSFTMKIRSIASTLLESPDQRKGQLALQAQEYLSAFLKILMKLERVSPANSDPDQPEDEDAELRAWADLRDYQLKFAQQGGLAAL